MHLTNKYKRVPLADIKVLRDERQRKVLEVDDLLSSISQRGVLNPIILSDEYVLVAGERRLEASRKLGLPDIPVRFISDLSPIEAQIIELEENIKRTDLEWRDNLAAVAKIHSLYSSLDPEWNQTQTAEAIGLSVGVISMYLRVAREIDSPRLAGAPSIRAAYNILARVDDRNMADAVTSIISAGAGIVNKPDPRPTPEGEGAERPKESFILPPEETILNLDFLSWAPSYSGHPFNFIHCDFPYGVNLFGGAWSGKNSWQTYGDTPDIYWDLLDCLCQNLDRLMAPSAHLLFWFSMDHYTKTLEFFRRKAPSLEVQNFPLIWFKSDNVGIMPDPKRGPRRVYETALMASREDRLVLKPVANAYHAPTDKANHPSTKPEPMLRHFFQMFVDGGTRMLDPTCGSGSAIRAAESLGMRPEHGLGLEADPEYCANARGALKRFRVLKAMEKK